MGLLVRGDWLLGKVKHVTDKQLPHSGCKQAVSAEVASDLAAIVLRQTIATESGKESKKKPSSSIWETCYVASACDKLLKHLACTLE